MRSSSSLVALTDFSKFNWMGECTEEVTENATFKALCDVSVVPKV